MRDLSDKERIAVLETKVAYLEQQRNSDRTTLIAVISIVAAISGSLIALIPYFMSQ
jgi:SNF family Na+-dependent transporter